VLSQPEGQQPSPPAQAVMGVAVHRAEHVEALPVSASVVHASASSQEVGQFEGGSQVSPGSTTPLPHKAEQSVSVASSQPSGQQPSPPVQAVTGSCVHRAEHVAALPVMRSSVQGSVSPQDVGQLEGGSQVSPASIVPLPHVVEQSESVAGLHPAGQQPSPALQDVIGAWLQRALQLRALPWRVSSVQAFESSQAAGQDSGGSQVSPGSMMPLPQAPLSPSTPKVPAGWHAPAARTAAVVTRITSDFMAWPPLRAPALRTVTRVLAVRRRRNAHLVRSPVDGVDVR
jgi:hypothetical protein